MNHRVYNGWNDRKKIMISGMANEIVSGSGEEWETRNITTNETVFIKK